MKKLQIVEHANFNGVSCDFYQTEDGEFVTTVARLAACLGYADKSGVEKIIQRNPYLKEKEFSSTDFLSVPQGDGMSTQETRVFNEDGIYEVTMLSKQHKAREFRAFVRTALKELRKGHLKLVQTDQYKNTLAETKLRNARSREAALWLKIGQEVDKPEYKQICASYASSALAGAQVLPLPASGQKHFSATEVGKMFGVSSQKIGSLSNKHHLKTEEYGQWFHDKSPYSAKEVDTFKYNDKGIDMFKQILAKQKPA